LKLLGNQHLTRLAMKEVYLMHSKFVKAIFAVILFVGFSLMSFDFAYAARARDYSPSELRSVLNGLGYNITLGDTLTDEAHKC
jgi:hypothetical protein